MPFTTLISAAELRGLRDPLIVEVSFDLADTAAGERQYEAGHIAGAFYLHLDRDLCGPTTGADGRFLGRHPLPDRAAFAETLRRIGLTADRQVVAYDRQGGPYAARLWWMLRWMGHDAVAVLNGTWDGDMTADRPQATASQWQPGASTLPLIDANALLKRLGNVRLIDARAAERFRGEVEPLDRAAGHIPGARQRFFRDNLAPDGRFKPADQLRQEFAALIAPFAAADVVQQCGSGVTACHNLLAMAHAGLGDSQLYGGSWSEWSSDPARPLAKG